MQKWPGFLVEVSCLLRVCPCPPDFVVLEALPNPIELSLATLTKDGVQVRIQQGVGLQNCGVVDNAYKLEPKKHSDKNTHVRKGVWKCGGCREQFTVTVGTIFEDSHIPLSKWLLAYHLLCASKKGMSAHQLHRMLKVTYRSAWFMAHRIRYTMSQEPLSSKLQGVIEIDEAYIGGKRRHRQPMAVKPGARAQDRIGPFADKAPVVSVLQRGGR